MSEARKSIDFLLDMSALQMEEFLLQHDDAFCCVSQYVPTYCSAEGLDAKPESSSTVLGIADSSGTESPSSRSVTSHDDEGSVCTSCCTLDTDHLSSTTPPNCLSPCQANRLVHECGPFAHADDVKMLVVMFDLCLLPHSDGDSARHLLRSLEMLRRCGYAIEDIRIMVSMATVYFNDTYHRKGLFMDCSELKYVLVLALFVAHCFVEDEMCPLATWHKWLFQSYCTLQELNSAVLRLCTLRDFRLRIDDDELFRRCELLREAALVDLK